MNVTVLLFCLAAVFLAIFLSRKTGLNTGLYAIVAQTGIAPIVMSALIVWGAGAGGCVPWSSAGAILCGLISESEFARYGVRLSLTVCLNFFLGGLFCLTVLYLLTGGVRTRKLEMEPPRAVTRKQSLTLWIMPGELALTGLFGIWG